MSYLSLCIYVCVCEYTRANICITSADELLYTRMCVYVWGVASVYRVFHKYIPWKSFLFFSRKFRNNLLFDFRIIIIELFDDLFVARSFIEIF